MRVFVTGATGFIGSGGPRVDGRGTSGYWPRSDASAKSLASSLNPFRAAHILRCIGVTVPPLRGLDSC